MKEIRICWLYGDLLDLYGDSGNIRIIEFYLKEKKIPYVIEEKGLFDEIDFCSYDFIYCGPGKAKNLAIAADDIFNKRDSLLKAAEKGTVMLFAGSSMILLGKQFTDHGGTVHPCASLFDYSAVDKDTVMTEDVFTDSNLTAETVYGFVNRTMVLEGDDEKQRIFIRNNVVSTWLLGPILVKNPGLLEWFFSQMTSEKLDMSGTLEEEAYRRTIAEKKQELRSKNEQ